MYLIHDKPKISGQRVIIDSVGNKLNYSVNFNAASPFSVTFEFCDSRDKINYVPKVLSPLKWSSIDNFSPGMKYRVY